MAKKKTETSRRKAATKVGRKTAAKKNTTKKKARKGPAKKKQTAKTINFAEFPPEQEFVRLRFIPVSPEIAFARANRAIQRTMKCICKAPEFSFVDVGYKYSGGKRLNDLAVRMHVRKKIVGMRCIKNSWESDIENELVPFDVIVSNFKNATGGIGGDEIRSNSNPGKFGTLGIGVTSSLSSNIRFLLTCAHVVSNQFPPTSINSIISDSTGRPICQSQNIRRRFFRYDNEFDVALMLPFDNTVTGNLASVVPQGFAPPLFADNPTQNDITQNTIVYKIGANTEFRTGFIDSINPSPIPVTEGATMANGQRPIIENHFIVKASRDAEFSTPNSAFANGGDSGSVVVTQSGRLLGMVRAILDDNADNEGDRTVVTPIKSIFDEFSISDIV